MDLKDRTGLNIVRGFIVKTTMVTEKWIRIGNQEFLPLYINNIQMFKKVYCNIVVKFVSLIITIIVKRDGWRRREIQFIQSLTIE